MYSYIWNVSIILCKRAKFRILPKIVCSKNAILLYVNGSVTSLDSLCSKNAIYMYI